MVKNLNNTTKIFAVLIGAVILIMIILFSISGNKAPTQTVTHFMKDTASADNKVEALKTVSADLQSVEKKNTTLEKNIASMQAQHAKDLANFKEQIQATVKQVTSNLQNQNTEMEQKLETELAQKKSKQVNYPVNGESAKGKFTWVADISPVDTKPKAVTQKTDDLSSLTHNLLNNNSSPIAQTKKTKVKPVYTIPENATLTGATLMTPLVGRIPIGGKLTSPYHFKLVLSGNNITANGVPLPGIHGAVASGIASGDLLGGCARGDINSITFIFNDGTISTTSVSNSDSTDDSDASLGYISTPTGNPCIPGKLHTDAALFLGAQVGFGAVQGYANSISNSQYMQGANSSGETFKMLMGNADKAAAGQALSSGAEAAQTWWNQRVQSSHDFVYVSNVKSGHPRKIVVNISQQIPINYNPDGRKVSYENPLQTLNTHLD